MEFTKHLVLSLESTEIESWLASDSDSAIADQETTAVQRPRRRITRGVIRKIYAKLIVSGLSNYRMACELSLFLFRSK